MNIRSYLKKKKLLSDGAFGTYYSSLTDSADTLSEKSNIENPDIVENIHKAYIQSGARLIRTNTFAANLNALRTNRQKQEQIIKAGFEIAKKAAKEYTTERYPVFIAADIGPIFADVSDDFQDLLDEYKRMADIFLDCGADIFLFETFPDTVYLKPLAQYIKDKAEMAGNDIFIIAQFCLNRYGYTKSGISGVRIFKEVSVLDSIDAVGFNCGIGSGHLYNLLQKMNLNGPKFVTAMPNSSYPEQLHDRMVYLDNINYFADKLEAISDLGVHILGGCCGTNPAYIKAVQNQIRFDTPGLSLTDPLENKDRAVGKPLHNNFYKKLSRGEKVIAVELDPPYDANADKIMECANILKHGQVDMITFADSPMARGRVDSLLMGVKVHNEVDIPVMPHIACRDKNAIGIRAGLLGAYLNNIRNILIVTGDPIPSSDRRDYTGVFDFNSVKLMEFVKEMNIEHFADDPLYYGGALNFSRGRISKIVERMQRKMDAGASYFLTQPVFSKEGIERIKKIKDRIDAKILCGVMPLVSYRNANFIRNEVAGIDVPEEILSRYHEKMTREEGEETGIQIAREVIEELKETADGYYFMIPFNRVYLVKQILELELD